MIVELQRNREDLNFPSTEHSCAVMLVDAPDFPDGERHPISTKHGVLSCNNTGKWAWVPLDRRRKDSRR